MAALDLLSSPLALRDTETRPLGRLDDREPQTRGDVR